MNALEIIRAVESCGGKLVLENGRLIARAEEPLPEELKALVSEHKASIMVALGAPLDGAVSSILKELRPHLPAPLRKLSDDRLLALVNWSIIAAWEKAVREVHPA